MTSIKYERGKKTLSKNSGVKMGKVTVKRVRVGLCVCTLTDTHTLEESTHLVVKGLKGNGPNELILLEPFR